MEAVRWTKLKHTFVAVFQYISYRVQNICNFSLFSLQSRCKGPDFGGNEEMNFIEALRWTKK